MTKNQTPKAASQPAFEGKQVRMQDGLQMVNNGSQVFSEGLQMTSRPQQGNQRPADSNQASTQTTFTPAKGPKIPPMKK